MELTTARIADATAVKFAAPLGFKLTEVGLIPEDWRTARLGNLFEITSSKRVFQSEWKTDGVPFYRAREVALLSTRGSVDNSLFITKDKYDAFRQKYGVPEVDDLLVTGVGTLGKVYVVPDKHEFYFKDGNIIWFKIQRAVNARFLRQLYLTPLLERQIADSSAGTTVGTYTISGAKRTEVPLPPHLEQDAIADALSDADALIESLEQLIAKKRQIKQGAMQELLSGTKRLPGYAGDWKKRPLGDVAEVKTGPFGSALHERDYVETGTPIITVEHLGERGVEHSNLPLVSDTDRQRLKAYALRENDIVFSRVGSVDRNALIRASETGWLFSGRLLRVRLTKEICFAPFISHYFHTEWFKELVRNVAVGQTMASLNTRILSGINILLPHLAEQIAIAEVLSRMDLEIEALEARLTKTRDLKQGMLQELLTGKIRLPIADTAS